MQRKRYLTPLTWPAISFAAMILLGTLALCLPVCHGEGASLSVVDAAFLSTSAVCVTGLSPVDISQVLSPVGQGVMLVLIQVGGLGVMTYTSLIFLLWRKQVPFTSREAVSQALLGGDFNMGQFLLQVVCIVLGVELLAALVLFLHLHRPGGHRFRRAAGMPGHPEPGASGAGDASEPPEPSGHQYQPVPYPGRGSADLRGGMAPCR